MLALYAASALRALGWIGPFLYLGAYYVERHGLSLRQVGLAYMVASGGMFAGNLAAALFAWRPRLALPHPRHVPGTRPAGVPEQPVG